MCNLNDFANVDVTDDFRDPSNAIHTYTYTYDSNSTICILLVFLFVCCSMWKLISMYVRSPVLYIYIIL